jgi:hypothetical protein
MQPREREEGGPCGIIYNPLDVARIRNTNMIVVIYSEV